MIGSSLQSHSWNVACFEAWCQSVEDLKGGYSQFKLFKRCSKTYFCRTLARPFRYYVDDCFSQAGSSLSLQTASLNLLQIAEVFAAYLTQSFWDYFRINICKSNLLKWNLQMLHSSISFGFQDLQLSLILINCLIQAYDADKLLVEVWYFSRFFFFLRRWFISTNRLFSGIFFKLLLFFELWVC